MLRLCWVAHPKNPLLGRSPDFPGTKYREQKEQSSHNGDRDLDSMTWAAASLGTNQKEPRERKPHWQRCHKGHAQPITLIAWPNAHIRTHLTPQPRDPTILLRSNQESRNSIVALRQKGCGLLIAH